jgi:hypothetical protein
MQDEEIVVAVISASRTTYHTCDIRRAVRSAGIMWKIHMMCIL